MPSKPAPDCYVEWVNQHLGFNPRGQQQSDFLSQCIVDDLRQLSPQITSALDSLSLTYTVNMSVHSRVVGRVIDLVLHDPKSTGPLDQARIAVEHKTVMTAHGKARKNRLGDIVAYCNHIHNHSRRAIAAATIVINISSEYENPDRFRTDTTRRTLSPDYIRKTMELFTALPLREGIDEPNDQPEALTVVVVNYDGVHEAQLVTDYPAFEPDSPHYYGNFLSRITRLYEARFSS
jgi:hypothetical protein